MLQIVFPNESQEQALKLRDQICESLVGVPAYVENDIIVCSQDLDPSGKPLVDDGNLTFVENGIAYEHCVIIAIKCDVGTNDVPFTIIISKRLLAYISDSIA